MLELIVVKALLIDADVTGACDEHVSKALLLEELGRKQGSYKCD